MRKEEIKEMVLDQFQISGKEFIGRKRIPKVINARKAYSYLLSRNMRSMTLSEIGDDFGKDHSMIIYYIKCAYNHVYADNSFATKVNLIETVIREEKKPVVDKKEVFMSGVDWSGVIKELNQVYS